MAKSEDDRKGCAPLPYSFLKTWRYPMIALQTSTMGGQIQAKDGQQNKSLWTPAGITLRKQNQSEPEVKVFPDQGTDQKTIGMKELEENIRELQKMSDMMDRKIQFSVNKELDRVVVKIVDPTTDTVVKEIPSRDMQNLQVHLRETLGLLVDEKS
jgi:flagellar protein FlaG